MKGSQAWRAGGDGTGGGGPRLGTGQPTQGICFALLIALMSYSNDIIWVSSSPHGCM